MGSNLERIGDTNFLQMLKSSSYDNSYDYSTCRTNTVSSVSNNLYCTTDRTVVSEAKEEIDLCLDTVVPEIFKFKNPKDCFDQEIGSKLIVDSKIQLFTLKDLLKDYEKNDIYFDYYLSHLETIGTSRWSDEDYEALSLIMDAAIQNNDGYLFSNVIELFIYNTKVSSSDTWGSIKSTYELGINKELLSHVLEHLDWRKRGKTYSTISRIANMPLDTVETVTYKDNGQLHKGYEWPCIYVTSFNDGGQFVIRIKTNDNTYDFKPVDMYTKLGETGVANLRNIGFSDEEICQFANSIFKKEDIQFVAGLGKAKTENDYYKVAQINPDKLSDAGKAAFAMYGSQIFDYSYNGEDEKGDGILGYPERVKKLIDFSNGMFLKRTDGGRYDADHVGNFRWTVDSSSYGKEYYELASALASIQAEQSAGVLSSYAIMDVQVDDAVCERNGKNKEIYNLNSKSILSSLVHIQQNNYDYLTYLAGLYEFDSDEYIKKQQIKYLSERAGADVKGMSLEDVKYNLSSNGRLTISYSGKLHTKSGDGDKIITADSSEITGEELDDKDRINAYIKAIENRRNKMIKAGFDFVTLGADKYLDIGDAGVSALGIIGALAQQNKNDVIKAGASFKVNDVNLDKWVASVVNGNGGTNYKNIPVASTYATVASSLSDILKASEEVDNKYDELMREWNQDGITVIGESEQNPINCVGAYDPETIYKWAAVKSKGLSVLCEDSSDVTNYTNLINELDIDASDWLSESIWRDYSADEKKSILLSVWAGEDVGGISFDDISNDQFIDAVGCLEMVINNKINYYDTAIGDTFSERVRNWEAY